MPILARVGLGLLQIALALIVFLNVHEVLHTVAARLLGDPTAHYVLYERYDEGFAIGRNEVNRDSLTPLTLGIVSLAGPLGTRLLSELLPALRRRGWTRPRVFWVALFVALRLDFIAYVIRNFIGDVFFGQSPAGQDIAEPLHLLGGESDVLRLILWLLVIVIASADVLLDRRRIRAFVQGRSVEP